MIEKNILKPYRNGINSLYYFTHLRVTSKYCQLRVTDKQEWAFH